MSMTPEEFLEQQSTFGEILGAMQGLFELVRKVKAGYMDEGGLGEDEMTVETFKAYLFNAPRPAPEEE